MLTQNPRTFPATIYIYIYIYIRLSFNEVCPLVSRKVKLCNTQRTLLGRCFRNVLQNLILVVLQDATLQLFLILCHTQGTTVKFNPLPHNTEHAFVLFKVIPVCAAWVCKHNILRYALHMYNTCICITTNKKK